MNNSLVIVQDVPTQFDVPLYNKIADESPFSLTVIYTQSADDDMEIGRKPIWDHIDKHRYHAIFLDKQNNRSVAYVIEEIRANRPDHVIVSGYWPKLHRTIMMALRREGISVGLRSDNTLPHSNLSGLKGWAKRLYLRRLLPKYTMWHPVGSLATGYLKALSGSSKPVNLFPYNTDNDWFKKNAQHSRDDRAAGLKKIGFPQQSRIILGIMKWAEREDPLTLLDAFEKYQAYDSNARLILIGDGPLRHAVMGKVKKLNGTVHTPGYVSYSQLPSWYGLADVFVHPAPNEPWGVSVNESLASGVLVIASNGVGAALDLVSQGHNGWVFEKGNTNSLVVALNEWHSLTDTLSQAELQQRCWRSLSRWNYQTTIQTFQDVLQNARPRN